MEREPFSPSLLVCIIILLAASLVIKPTPYRPLFCIPVVGIAYYLLYHTTSGDVVSDLGTGDTITPLVAVAFDYIVLTEPQLFKRSQKIALIVVSKPMGEDQMGARSVDKPKGYWMDP
jgi:hypothetical protein